MLRRPPRPRFSTEDSSVDKDATANHRTIDTVLFQAFRNYVRYHQQRNAADPLDFADASQEAKDMWRKVRTCLTEMRAAIGAYKAAHDVVQRADIRVGGWVSPDMKVEALSPELLPERSWAMENLQQFFGVWDHKENAWAVWLEADRQAISLYDFLVGTEEAPTTYWWLHAQGIKTAFGAFGRLPLPKREETKGRYPIYLEGPLPLECFEECEGAPVEAANDDGPDRDMDVERKERQDAFEQRAEAHIKSFGRTEMPVLFTGEPGVGKGYWAERLWEAYREAAGVKGKFVTVNCAAIPRELLEPELFGVVAGAHSTAHKDRDGKVKEAHGGILFLDEIGELEPAAQAKILRLVEEGKYSRLGENEEQNANVRFAAATNRDLKKAMGEGKFREDLYSRLSAGVFRVDPLRKRREEIPKLAGDFFKAAVCEAVCTGKPVKSKRFRRKERHELARMDYGWPENVRQLRNAIWRAIAVGGAKPLTAKEIVETAKEIAGRSDDR